MAFDHAGVTRAADPLSFTDQVRLEFVSEARLQLLHHIAFAPSQVPPALHLIYGVLEHQDGTILTYNYDRVTDLQCAKFRGCSRILGFGLGRRTSSVTPACRFGRTGICFSLRTSLCGGARSTPRLCKCSGAPKALYSSATVLEGASAATFH